MVPVGPAPAQPSTGSRQLEVLLFDRTGGQDQLVLPPGEAKVRTRAVIYQKRETTTAVMVDPEADPDGPTASGKPPDPTIPVARWTITSGERRSRTGTPAAEAILVARVGRVPTSLSDRLSLVPDGPLPPTPETFDGTDVFVLAGNRLAADPPGRAALRHWVQQGGRLWVMLDLVDPATVAALLGDDFDIGFVDRVGLTTLRLHRSGDNPTAVEGREVEQPISLVRVIPSAGDQVLHVVNGWPASFSRRVGRGKVLFTALGGRGWHRPRGERDNGMVGPGRPAVVEPTSGLPIALLPLGELAAELYPSPETDPLPPEALRPLLTEEIGYTIIGRETAAAILGGFVLTLLGLGLGLRRSRRPELVGWLGPAVALVAAGLFVGLGARSRQAVPPTEAVVELVDAIPGSGETTATGLYAVYHPTSGPATIATREGAMLALDTEGLDGQTRRRVQMDTGIWRFEGLTLPAGVRTGPFRSGGQHGRVVATARFGPDGIEGRLEVGRYAGPTDAIFLTAAREPVAVRFGLDGKFTATSSDALPPGQYLAGVVLTDRQQRRQAVYRQLLGGALPRHLEGRELLLAWAEPPDPPFTPEAGSRVIGTALLTVPLEFEKVAPDTRVTVPRGFIPFKRSTNGALSVPTMTASFPVDMRLRFQLPASVVPLKLERATVFVRVRAPGQKFIVSGVADGQPVRLYETDTPTEPIRVEITDERLLRTDAQGGLHLDVAIKGAAGTGESAETAWKIESLAMEAVGRTESR